MREIVINQCYGGFGLSIKAYELWLSKKEMSSQYDGDIPRDDKALVAVIRELGDSANGRFAELKIIEIPDDVKWHIEEYDGKEWVAEDHRTWN